MQAKMLYEKAVDMEKRAAKLRIRAWKVEGAVSAVSNQIVQVHHRYDAAVCPSLITMELKSGTREWLGKTSTRRSLPSSISWPRIGWRRTQ